MRFRKRLKTAQLVINMVHEELIATLGEAGGFESSGKSWVILLAGLQRLR
jgi:signal recognition particle GTPase